MSEKQWKILIRFMRFTSKILLHSVFKGSFGDQSVHDLRIEHNQFMRDTKEWL